MDFFLQTYKYANAHLEKVKVMWLAAVFTLLYETDQVIIAVMP